MTIDQKTTGAMRCGFLSTLGAFALNKRGVAAIEFALIAPILFAMYFLTLEFGQAIDVNKKLSRAANMAGDLVAQQPSITASEVDAVMKIGSAIMKPYNRSMPTMTLTAIEVTDEQNPKIKVVWSRELKNGTASTGLPKGSTTTLPEELNIKGAFYIRASAALGYKPILTWSKDGTKSTGLTAMAGLDNLQMSERFYLRPRMSSTVPCDDC
ncbi:TadE/TadG family type IV pilus assembly protein [Nitratireductor kimnyeongensis]|uniref:TadE/TadG family type IV pilus assembly protein n=1 Tax=Nitratireductor kimnyeongensis TaxID=430679 RepID=A0ABW0T7N0_9HYPH|nr:TadE/TadG family type IV pilus assembly protein [Nitratireductor kimnyeongensis]QZZ34116.1 pilus assembly protein [Nitratireductor kimnyeongensis]